MVSETSHQEKNQMGCWRQAWNKLQYKKVEKENCDRTSSGQSPCTIFIGDVELLARPSAKDGQQHPDLI